VLLAVNTLCMLECLVRYTACFCGVKGASEDDCVSTDAISCSLPNLSPTDACRREFGTVSLVQFNEATVGEIGSKHNTTGGV